LGYAFGLKKKANKQKKKQKVVGQKRRTLWSTQKKTQTQQMILKISLDFP
jgi:hypothetical protein